MSSVLGSVSSFPFEKERKKRIIEISECFSESLRGKENGGHWALVSEREGPGPGRQSSVPGAQGQSASARARGPFSWRSAYSTLFQVQTQPSIGASR